MKNDTTQLAARLERLERTARRTRVFTAAAGIGLLVTWVAGSARQQEPVHQDVIRVRLVVIEDDQGRDRIVLGAPMPDGRQHTGMKILNPDGAEQFAVSLKPDGRVGMGFDAAPGVGDPRNPERLNMGVTTTGQGWIRFLDNRTRARMLAALDSADVPWVQFLDWPDDQRILVRQIGFSGEETLEWTR